MRERAGVRAPFTGLRAGALGMALAVALAGTAAPGARAQTVADVAAACAGGEAALADPCLDGALAFQSVSALVGLAGAAGADLPGSTSTLGRRLGRSPRLGLALRVGGVSGALPDVTASGSDGAEATLFASAVTGVATAGVFDGFNPVPTVGGLFSLDLQASAGRVFLPGDQGFESGVNVLGLGARLGILRESFTLPGVTVAAAYRWAGDAVLGVPDDPTATGLRVDATTTSLRATVGKDLLALGLMGGFGWDRYGADGRVRVDGGGEADVDGLDTDRTLWFAGASYTFLVLQLSAEGGWAGGLRDVEGRPGTAYDPGAGRFFGSLAARLTF